MAEATKDDAQLVVQLAHLGTQMVPPQARGWIWSDEFVSDADEFREKYPPGSKEFDYVSGTATWYETVGTLWKHGLLNEELLFDWLYVTGMGSGSSRSSSHSAATRRSSGRTSRRWPRPRSAL